MIGSWIAITHNEVIAVDVLERFFQVFRITLTVRIDEADEFAGGCAKSIDDGSVTRSVPGR